MQSLCTIILLTLILSIAFRDTIQIVTFYANQDYIASTLCINKNKPELLCSGKCVLTKQIEENNSSEQLPVKRIIDLSKVAYTLNIAEPILAHTAINKEREKPLHIDSYFEDRFIAGIFHPPRPLIG